MRKIITIMLLGVFLERGVLVKAEAQIFKLNTVVNFDGTNGANPSSGLTLGNDGLFYGATSEGGSSSNGVLFKVTTNGAITALVDFNSTNGSSPNAALTLGNDGLFYGSTYFGGTNFNGGTLFQFNTNGTLTPLVMFNGVNSVNGKRPRAALLGSLNGLFYGSTFQGGIGYGSLFVLASNSNLTTLTNFNNSNGAFPNAALTWGRDGVLYGVTSQGGAYNLGTAFSLTTNGMLTTMVSFDGTNGSKPTAAMILGTDGEFYGSTSEGLNNSGTIFRMSTNGTVTTLVSFQGTNGASPNSPLILGSDGFYYGMTVQGGNLKLNGGLGLGTIFRMTTNGSLTTVAIFDSTNGALPYGALTLGADGNYYGTTSQGGSFNKGTVFRLAPLPPPVLNIAQIPGSVVLSWTNSLFSLQSAPEVTGGFTNIPGSTSPFTSSITGNRQFFRLQK